MFSSVSNLKQLLSGTVQMEGNDMAGAPVGQAPSIGGEDCDRTDPMRAKKNCGH